MNLLYSLKPSAEKSKELIIPLIRKNRWIQPDPQDQSETSGERTTADSESVDAQAVKELIEGELSILCFIVMTLGIGKLSIKLSQGIMIDQKPSKILPAESRKQLDQWNNDGQSERNLDLSIPLLMQNKAPDGFEDGDRVKVDLRPESVSRFSYSQVETVKIKKCFSSLTAVLRLLKFTQHLKPLNPRLHQTLCIYLCACPCLDVLSLAQCV